jgi:hypothetical protein
MKHLSFPCRDELYPEPSETLPTGLEVPALGFQVGKVRQSYCTVCTVLEATDDLVLHCCRKDSLHQLIKVKADNAKG